MAKNLVIYYSRSGQNFTSDGIKNLEKGNTQLLVEFIKKATDAVLFKIETADSYSDDYNKCIEEAKKELNANIYPELEEYLDDVSAYDNIVVAGPCWWGTYPMAVFSLLKRIDFTGKNVFGVMTHEGSGFGSSISDLKKYCKGANVIQGIAIQGSKVGSSGIEIETWAKSSLK